MVHLKINKEHGHDHAPQIEECKVYIMPGEVKKKLIVWV